MVTLGDVLLLNFDKRDLILNRTGEISANQRKLFRDGRVGGNPRIILKRPQTSTFIVLALCTLGPVLFIPIHGGVAALLSVVSVLVFIFAHFAYPFTQVSKALYADLDSGKVLMAEGVPQVIFEDGQAFVEIDGVRIWASSNLALQFKSQDIHRVYYTPNARVPLSYEILTQQDKKAHRLMKFND